MGPLAIATPSITDVALWVFGVIAGLLALAVLIGAWEWLTGRGSGEGAQRRPYDGRRGH